MVTPEILTAPVLLLARDIPYITIPFWGYKFDGDNPLLPAVPVTDPTVIVAQLAYLALKNKMQLNRNILSNIFFKAYRGINIFYNRDNYAIMMQMQHN